jgi:hypothetical protein
MIQSTGAFQITAFPNNAPFIQPNLNISSLNHQKCGIRFYAKAELAGLMD